VSVNTTPHPEFGEAFRCWLKLSFINFVTTTAFAYMAKWNWNIIPVVRGPEVM
jgi:hypothetical protein